MLSMTTKILLAVAATALVSGVCLRAATGPTDLPPHPRLLFNRQDIEMIEQRIATQPWAKAHFDAMKNEADGWLTREIKLPDRGGQWYHYYSCPKHGARLRTEGPNRHACAVDGEVLTGYPYDDVVLMGDHNRLAGALRTLGMVHQLTGDARHAAKAKETAYAWCVSLGSVPADLQWAPMRVTVTDGREPGTASVAMVQVTTPGGRHLLLANPAGEKITVAGQVVEGKIAHLVPGDGVKPHIQNAAP